MPGLGCTRHTEAALALLLSSAGHARALVQRQRCCEQPRESHSRRRPGKRVRMGSAGLSEDAAPASGTAGRQPHSRAAHNHPGNPQSHVAST